MSTIVLGRSRLLVLATFAAAVLASPGYAQTTHSPGKVPAPKGQHDAYILSFGASRLLEPGNDAMWNAEDARDHDAFWKKQKGRMFREVYPWLFTDETATVANFERTMEEIEARVQPGDTVIPGLSGHGTDPHEGEFRYCAHDGYIPKSVIHKWMKRLSAKGARVIFIIEACYSGALLEINEPNVVFLVSSGANEPSLNGSRFLLKGNSVFYQVLFEALSGKADANGDGIITLEEVIAYLKKRVPAQARVGGLEQNPQILYGNNVPQDAPLAEVVNPTQPGVVPVP